MNAAAGTVAWLFDPRGRVTARTYLRTGLALVVIKYAVDAALVWLAVGRLWRPTGYLAPLLGVSRDLPGAPGWLFPVLALWAVPFLAIGVSLSLRRLTDAGLTPWFVLLFLFPLLNYLLMAALCIQPTAVDLERAVVTPPVEEGSIRDALLALGAAVSLTLLSVALNTLALRTYSAGLFMGTPFSVGVVAGYFYNWKRLHTLGSTSWVVVVVLLAASIALLMVALEGAACLIFALPIAFLIAWVGAVVGRQIAIRGVEDVIRVGGLIFAIPFAQSAAAPAAIHEHEVRSATLVAAPPEVVWRRVIAFGDLEEPPSGMFRFGIAYPVGATIDGEGVGAVRRCEFSTGAFIEPITVWDAPRRLSFDVAEQPRPMRELSPYAEVHAPHLDGFLVSRRGEFRLVALPGGRTRLEGSTWYTLEMQPLAYWQPIADALIHAIHLRVLRHVRSLAETDAGGPK